jgi:Protein of unknown function (DUF3052)
VGSEAKCAAASGRKRSSGTAHLETHTIVFRGDFRVSLVLRTLTKVEAKDGRLRLAGPDGDLTLDLGPLAAKWADKIRNPRSRLDKLGLKPGQRVAVLGVRDPELKPAPLKPGTDVVFYAADRREDLERLAELRRSIAPDGSIWVVRPRGSKDISEADVMSGARAAGLVDVKVVRFSDTHTAEKLVIPRADR